MSDMDILIIIVVATVIIFFLTREFWCWYFKINKKIELMNTNNEYQKILMKKLDRLMEIRDEIKTTNDILREKHITNEIRPKNNNAINKNEEEEKIVCFSCKHKNNLKDEYCKECGNKIQ